VKGLEIFRRHFDGLDQHYALIGGAACYVIMDEVGLEFRATKDIDIVILVELLDPAFGARFWAFIEAGGYEQRERSSGGKEFYRFQKPSNTDYPSMLEIFSRPPATILPAEGSALTPLPIDEDIASLSAILLDEDYYAALVANKRAIDGITVLDERLLIPFKAKAHLDLAQRREAGDAVDAKTVRKHRTDVFRLLQLLRDDERIALPDPIRADLTAFADKVDADGDFTPKDAGLRGTAAELTARLRRLFAVAGA
jgi:hypothetical protein